jgi:Spy/CpxP family protein refolding chaperone
MADRLAGFRLARMSMLVVAAALASRAGAQTDPMAGPTTKPEKSQTPARQPDPGEDPLAGPKVDKQSDQKTIIERSFDGNLVRLDTRPEQAAAALLTLTDDQRAAVNKLFEERSKEVSRVLYDNFDAFLAVQASRQAGGRRPDNKERDDVAMKTRQLRKAGIALVEPPLVEQVAKVLPDEQIPEFRRLVEEYMVALEEQAIRDNGRGQGAFLRPGNPTAEGPGRGPAVRERSEMNLYLRELARSLGALVQERREQTEALIKAVDATPEQAEEIQKIIRAAGEKSGGNPGRRPTPEQRAETFRKIMDVLTPEQRQKAREHMRPQ